MIAVKEESLGSNTIAFKARAYFDLLKFRLSVTVAFSAVFGYSLGVDKVIWSNLVMMLLASLTITGAANIINQLIEKDLDKLMKRTKDRPLPSGRLTSQEAIGFGLALFVAGILIFTFFFNLRSCALAVLSLILYGFVYTPLKRVGPIAVFVGALPGAFPPMIGWVAATNHFGLEPGILFAIQFFWQFPHFWAIAWVLDEDYGKAGFKLLPAKGEKDINTAFQIIIYTICLLPVSWLPYYLGMTGINSAFVATVFGVLFLIQTFHLMRKCTDKAALQLMFGSFVYLPVVQIAFLLDKI
ncbi:MAG: protoheme IX farnesyltransferase [Runella slithyformis]|nr:MAG: protoheme IX farnesyltransferase [Runella slithyformis]TAE93344.1 MAG: protoheme IX farnesyltransferase [Runella slithyformis]TAF27442.1 MAG: protoheme IX farnesyltransferase [Runella slithyformis]TAF46006.1 MAG: protoheme IX farnesyltransferase [Runella slithyformis]TAF81307.1 MAG: protoheme IX farnesyltransferase [Runella slithyformis]